MTMRWAMIAAMVLSALAAAPGLAAEDAIDIEVTEILERMKSPDAAKRTQAVCELVSLRQSVSDALKAIVADANAGVAKDTGKMSAIVLMGDMGLVDCAEILNQEREWLPDRKHWRGVRGAASKVMTTRRVFAPIRIIDGPSMAAINLGMTAGLRAEPGTARADLAQYPALAAALAKMRVEDPNVCFEGEQGVALWYNAIGWGADSIVSRWGTDGGRRTPIYSDDIALTAAYVIGEFRWPKSEEVSRCSGLRDVSGVTASYAHSLTVEGADANYPAAVALAKCGGRAWGAALLKARQSITSTEAHQRRTKVFVAAMKAQEEAWRAEKGQTEPTTPSQPEEAPAAVE
jgi:hypothetical protein